jgi:hypothetical protein
MKNIIKFLALGAALMAFIVACDKDEEDGGNGGTNVSQELILDSTAYALSTGFIIKYGTEDGVANFDLNLVSDGVTFTFDSLGLPDNVTGSGQVIYMETWSADTSLMADGTYTLILDSTNAGSISYGEIISISNGNPTAFYEMTSCVMQVSVAGNVHTIMGSGKTSSDLDFSFSFKKELAYIEDDSFKKKFRF